jgi:hypothetical protein
MFHATVHSGGLGVILWVFRALRTRASAEDTDTNSDHGITPAKAHQRHEAQVLKAGWP